MKLTLIIAIVLCCPVLAEAETIMLSRADYQDGKIMSSVEYLEDWDIFKVSQGEVVSYWAYKEGVLQTEAAKILELMTAFECLNYAARHEYLLNANKVYELKGWLILGQGKTKTIKLSEQSHE